MYSVLIKFQTLTKVTFIIKEVLKERGQEEKQNTQGKL